MGCFQSRQIKPSVEKKVPCPEVVNTESLSTEIVENSERVADLKVSASKAGWIADSNFGDYVRIVGEEGGAAVFVCLFDPHTTNDAAAFCVGRCHDVFKAAMKKCNRNPMKALELTVENLDRQFLTSGLDPAIRALSGCSGVLVYVDLVDQRSWIASIGTCQCLIGTAEGAFNSRTMEGKTITNRHDAENLSEQDSLKERFPEEAENVLQSINGRSLVKGITKLMRCIGYGFAKVPELAKVYNKNATKPLSPLPNAANPYVLSKPQVEECDLSKGAEKLVLYTEGMGELLSPNEMAVFAMHFDKSVFSQLAETRPASASEDEVHASVELQSVACPAAALIRHAVSKAAENFVTLMRHLQQTSKLETATKQDKATSLGLKDMQLLPVKHAFSTEQPKDGSSITRKDLHGNLACAVVSLDFTNNQRRLFSPPSRTSSMSPTVLYRWKLIQLFCKFHIQRRRTCLRRWWQLIALAVRDAQQKILDDEKALWHKLMTEASGTAHVTLKQSSSLEKETVHSDLSPVFPQRISSGFRKWLDTPSQKRLGASIDSKIVSSKVLCL